MVRSECRKMVLGMLMAGAAVAGARLVHAQTGGGLQMNGSAVELRVGVVGDGIARFEVLPVGADGAAAEAADGPLIVAQKWRQEPLKIRAAGTNSQKVGEWTVSVDTTKGDGWVVKVNGASGGAEVRIDPASGKVLFPVDGPIFGLGEGGKPFDRRGAVNPQVAGGWNDANYPLNDWGEQCGVPWAVSPTAKGGAFGVYMNSGVGSVDLTGEKEGAFVPGAAGGQAGRRGGGAPAAGGGAAGPRATDGFLVVAKEPAGVMKGWSEITGYPSLVPIWSLGYIQSHREVASGEEILAEAQKFREKQMPCDMLIYLGTGFVPMGWNTGHGEFKFNDKIFSKPEEQLKAFHDLHFKVMMHVTPQGANVVRRAFGSVNDPVPADAAYDPNNMAMYWKLHVPLMKQGVDGWWPDEGEVPVAANRLSRIQMYWEGPQQVNPDQRPFALHRTGAVGMARYGGWLWSGDIKSTWDCLARHVPLGLNVSAGLTPYWGTDTGGFYDPARELTGELFARWFQYSTFCTLFRSHGQAWRTKHLPWGYGDIQGPQKDDRIEGICKKYLDLRYQLMPYTYSAVYEGHEDGMPVQRALWMHYPADAAAVAKGDEYLWGRDLLVAPVVEKGASERKVYLPAGGWFDWWTGQPVEGGKEVVRKVDLETMPIYARAGAIVPMGPVENYTLEKPNDPLTVRVFPGADGKFTMIEDDGVTFSSKLMRLGFTWDNKARTLRMALEGGTAMREPLVRHVRVVIAGGEEKSVEFRGEALEVKL